MMLLGGKNSMGTAHKFPNNLAKSSNTNSLGNRFQSLLATHTSDPEWIGHLEEIAVVSCPTCDGCRERCVWVLPCAEPVVMACS